MILGDPPSTAGVGPRRGKAILALAAGLVLLGCLGTGRPLLALDANAQPDLGACSLRLEIEGVGTVLACPPPGGLEGGTSQLLLQRPGGMVEVIYSLEGLSFVSLLRGDLDGDQAPEVVAIARNPSSEDLLPYIFSEKEGFACLYPREDEDTSLIGEEIQLVGGKDGTTLCIRNEAEFHRFGPPLIQSEYYRLVSRRLQKTGESFSEGTHFSQMMNRAAIAMQRAEYLQARKGYQEVLSRHGSEMPADATAEALFYEAEACKYLKDFPGADRLYQKVLADFPDNPMADSARKEHEFLAAAGNATAALSLLIDAGRLNTLGRGDQTVSLLEAYLATNASGPLGDHLLFLQGEALVSVGRTDEAVKVFQRLKGAFPASPLVEDVEIQLEELLGTPEETEEPPGSTP